MRFARKACGCEQSSGEQETSARHSQKPLRFRDSRGRASATTAGRYPMRTAGLPGPRHVEVHLLQRLDSLTFRPPGLVLIGEANSRRRADRPAARINATAFTGPHTEITNELAFRDAFSHGSPGGMADHAVRGSHTWPSVGGLAKPHRRSRTVTDDSRKPALTTRAPSAENASADRNATGCGLVDDAAHPASPSIVHLPSEW